MTPDGAGLWVRPYGMEAVGAQAGIGALAGCGGIGLAGQDGPGILA